MLKFETEHYVFNYHENSIAEKEIEMISTHQEACFTYISHVLNVQPDFKIEYFLCNSPEEVGHIFGDDEPCSGYAEMPNKIYASYNKNLKCIGFHEDAHIISYCVNRPNSCAIREGLAMFFDKKWWRISNFDWTLYYLNHGQFTSIDEILDDDNFFSYDCTITYPIVGAFTEYLILKYGSEKYKEFYCCADSKIAIEKVYDKSAKEINDEFLFYMNLFLLDEKIEKRISQLLAE